MVIIRGIFYHFIKIIRESNSKFQKVFCSF